MNHKFITLGKYPNIVELCTECDTRFYPYAINGDAQIANKNCIPSEYGKNNAKNTIEAYNK